MWSKEPWDIPMVKIRIKHKIVEILKVLNLNDKIEIMLIKTKKINEWFKFIFLILFLILNYPS